MTREEARKHLIDWVSYVENPNSIPDFDQPCSADEIIESMKIGAEALFKIELPEGMEEAAENYRRESCNAALKPHIDGPMPEYGGSIKEAFIAGAEWGRKQVLQEIYEGKVKPVDKITAAWLDDE